MHSKSLRGGAATRGGAQHTARQHTARQRHKAAPTQGGSTARGSARLGGARRCRCMLCGELVRCGELWRAIYRSMDSWAGRAHLDELALVEPGLLAEGVAAVDLVLVEGDSDDARAGELADVAAAAEVRASGWNGWAQQRKARGTRHEARGARCGGFERAVTHSGPPMPQPQSSTRSDSCKTEVVRRGARLLSVRARVGVRSGVG